MGVLEYREVDPRVAEVALALLEEGGEVDAGTRPGILLGRVLGDAPEREGGVKRQLTAKNSSSINRNSTNYDRSNSNKVNSIAVTEAAGDKQHQHQHSSNCNSRYNAIMSSG